MPIFELYLKRRVRHCLLHITEHFNDIFLAHPYLVGRPAPLKFAFFSKLSYWCDMMYA